MWSSETYFLKTEKWYPKDEKKRKIEKNQNDERFSLKVSKTIETKSNFV